MPVQRFSGARVSLAAAESSASRAGRHILWSQEDIDTDGYWESSAPERLVVPAGVTRVEVFMGLKGNTDLATDASLYGAILKNPSVLDGTSPPGSLVAANLSSSQGYNAQGFTVSTGPIDVVAGDFFIARINSTDTSWGLSNEGTFLAIVALDGPLIVNGSGGGGGGGGSLPEQILDQVTALVGRRDLSLQEFNNWKSGSATGGPNSDGRYPMTDGAGTIVLVPCPARIFYEATRVMPANITVSSPLTLDDTHYGKKLRITSQSGTPQTLNLPNDAPVGTTIIVRGMNAAVRFVPASGATLSNANSHNGTSGPGSAVSLSVESNTGSNAAWYLDGSTGSV